MITRKEAAACLDGNRYGEEGSRELFSEMSKAGLVAIFGSSDDLTELQGAIDDEKGCDTIYVTRKGIFQEKCEAETCPYDLKAAKMAATIQPLYGKLIDTTWEQGVKHIVPWSYETTIPHDTFTIIDEGKPFCRGIVFALKDVPALAGDRVRHKKRGTFYTVITRSAIPEFVSGPLIVPPNDMDWLTVLFYEHIGKYLVTNEANKAPTTAIQLTRYARLQCEGGVGNADMTLYVGDDGVYSVRPTAEFEDGRFEMVP